MNGVIYKYGGILSSEEQEYAFKKLISYAKKQKINHNIKHFSLVNTAKLISLFKNHSGRTVSSIVFRPGDPRHETQMDGRDVKRWAAEVLGELEEACGSWAN